MAVEEKCGFGVLDFVEVCHGTRTDVVPQRSQTVR